MANIDTAVLLSTNQPPTHQWMKSSFAKADNSVFNYLTIYQFILIFIPINLNLTTVGLFWLSKNNYKNVANWHNKNMII